MIVEVGQDALGEWAWMLIDEQGWCVASGQFCPSADIAMEEGLNHLELRERSARRSDEGRGR